MKKWQTWVILGLLIIVATIGVLLLRENQKKLARDQYGKFIANIWQEIQSRNLGFQKESVQLCKSKISGKPFASIKMLAAKNKEAIMALTKQMETVSVPESFAGFHKELKAAANDTIVFYDKTIEICGDPATATFGTLMSAAQSAKDKFISCTENYGLDLNPKIPNDMFLKPGDNLSFVVRRFNRSESMANIPSARNREFPTAQSSYIVSMRSIMNRYGESRDVFQTFCNWVRNKTSVTRLYTFRNQLDRCLSTRIQLKNEAEELLPTIGFDSYHQEFISILDEAILATRCAINFLDNPSTAGDDWRKFQVYSTDISRRMPAVANAYGVRW